jgi:vacuolar-type H+-ATPase subunit H
MNILHMGSRVISRSSPMLLAVTGTAMAFAFPPVRRGLRSAAVLATKGALIVSDGVKEAAARMRENAESIVQEAREMEDHDCPCTAVKSMGASVKNKSRRMAVSTTAGLLSMKDRAKSAREELKSIVNEAKERRAASFEETAQPAEMSAEHGEASFSDGLETQLPDIGPDSPQKKRSTPRKNPQP